MFPINLHMNRNHRCGEGAVLKNLNVFFLIWRSTPGHVTRKSATRQGGVQRRSKHFRSKTLHYTIYQSVRSEFIARATKTSPPNPSSRPRPPDRYYYQSPGHYGDGNISAIRRSSSFTRSLSSHYIYLRPKTHRFVVFVVIIIVIPKLYGVRIT